MQERRGAGQEPGDSWPQPPLPPQREKERAEGEGREKRLWFSSTVTGKHTGSRVDEVRGKERESRGGAGRLFIEAVFSFCESVYASQMRGARWTVAGLCILFFSFTRTNVPFSTRVLVRNRLNVRRQRYSVVTFHPHRCAEQKHSAFVQNRRGHLT